MAVYARWIDEDGRWSFCQTDNGGVVITDAEHAAFFGEAAMGKIIGKNSNGLPELMDLPPPTPEEQERIERSWRDATMSATQWLMERHRDEQLDEIATTLSVMQFDELRAYRQALRDWPADARFPMIEYRPASPAWLSAQPDN